MRPLSQKHLMKIIKSNRNFVRISVVSYLKRTDLNEGLFFLFALYNSELFLNMPV